MGTGGRRKLISGVWSEAPSAEVFHFLWRNETHSITQKCEELLGGGVVAGLAQGENIGED